MTERSKSLRCALLPGTFLPWLALLAASCGSDGSETKAGRAQVRVALLPFLSNAPLILAREEGDFAAQGLEVEFVRMAVSKGAVASLLRGDLDVLPAFPGPGLLNAMARGGGVRFVADKGRFPTSECLYQALVMRDALLQGRPGLESGADVLTLSVDATTVSHFFVERALEQAGLPVERLRVVTIPNEAELDALAQGSIDLAVLSDPWLTRFVGEGRGTIWKTAGSVLPGFQFAVVAYGPSLTERRPEVGKRFMTAYLQGVRRYNEGKTSRNVAILAKATGLQPALLRTTCWPEIHSDGRIDAESIRAFQQWALEKGYVDRVLPADEWWDPRFVDHADGALAGTAASTSEPERP